MPEAYVIGAGQSPFGSYPEETYLSLFDTAFDRALDSVVGSFDPDRIEAAYLGHLGVGGRQIGLSGPAVTEHVGLKGLPTTRIENACAASGYAFSEAVSAVRQGELDVALAGGYDQTRWWLGVSGETAWERMAGTTFAGVYAQMASAYLAEHGISAEALARVAVKNHGNGAENPNAHLGFSCTLEDAMNAPSVADPLNLYHCCPTTDGASAAVVANGSVIEELGATPVRVAGSGTASGRVGLFQRGTLTSIPASRRAADRAYADAGIGADALDFAEVHDCFAIAELLAYEDLGFCDSGEAAELLEAGYTDPDGELPVNTSGGLKSKGHPIGATGTGQIVEAVEQLRGTAHVQVDDPRYGLAHNVGGSGGGVAVHVLEREAGA
jgi:acetyl-CoA C-acetyltransferase